jgi:hypothetical protein
MNESSKVFSEVSPNKYKDKNKEDFCFHHFEDNKREHDPLQFI